jgi:thiol-disulfide isomerase/thioredoxin
VRLSDFRGKPVVLNFWASWCPPCRGEMPDFDKTYRSLGNEIHFVMVNLTDEQSETVEVASAFLEDAGYSFPVYFDTSGMSVAAYGISSIPMTFFINASGELVTWKSGAISESLLLQGIDLIR